MNARLDELKLRLEKERSELEELERRRLEIVATGQTWTMRDGDNTRSVENVSLSQLNSLISDKRRTVSDLEERIARGGRTGKVCVVGGLV